MLEFRTMFRLAIGDPGFRKEVLGQLMGKVPRRAWMGMELKKELTGDSRCRGGLDVTKLYGFKE